MATDDEMPPTEYIVEFGEPIPLRPGGCPNCSDPIVYPSSTHCSACGAEFDPIDSR